MILGDDMSGGERDLSRLLEIKARYDHVLAMAREVLCTCNSARDPTAVGRDVVEYLLRGGDLASHESLGVRTDLRSQHCLLHSPRVPDRPWLLEVRP
jgi:hypothetical protein